VCVCVGAYHLRPLKAVSLSLSLSRAPSAKRRCHPKEALYLPTFSHLLVVNKLLSLSRVDEMSFEDIRGIQDTRFYVCDSLVLLRYCTSKSLGLTGEMVVSKEEGGVTVERMRVGKGEGVSGGVAGRAIAAVSSS
jgi:hypothetical protein